MNTFASLPSWAHSQVAAFRAERKSPVINGIRSTPSLQEAVDARANFREAALDFVGLDQIEGFDLDPRLGFVKLKPDGENAPSEMVASYSLVDGRLELEASLDGGGAALYYEETQGGIGLGIAITRIGASDDHALYFDEQNPQESVWIIAG